MATIGHNKNYVSINSLSVEEKKKLKNTILELNDSMTRTAAEKELQKQAIDEIFDQLGVDKKIVRRMAKVYYKANYNTETEEENMFRDFYEGVIKDTVQ